jgi:hypothetical protein
MSDHNEHLEGQPRVVEAKGLALSVHLIKRRPWEHKPNQRNILPQPNGWTTIRLVLTYRHAQHPPRTPIVFRTWPSSRLDLKGKLGWLVRQKFRRQKSSADDTIQKPVDDSYLRSREIQWFLVKMYKVQLLERPLEIWDIPPMAHWASKYYYLEFELVIDNKMESG